jgi:hypothetical protein
MITKFFILNIDLIFKLNDLLLEDELKISFHFMKQI